MSRALRELHIVTLLKPPLSLRLLEMEELSDVGSVETTRQTAQ